MRGKVLIFSLLACCAVNVAAQECTQIDAKAYARLNNRCESAKVRLEKFKARTDKAASRTSEKIGVRYDKISADIEAILNSDEGQKCGFGVSCRTETLPSGDGVSSTGYEVCTAELAEGSAEEGEGTDTSCLQSQVKINRGYAKREKLSIREIKSWDKANAKIAKAESKTKAICDELQKYCTPTPAS